jgi:hypothetical protein
MGSAGWTKIQRFWTGGRLNRPISAHPRPSGMVDVLSGDPHIVASGQIAKELQFLLGYFAHRLICQNLSRKRDCFLLKEKSS